mgnify:CR=1 FL=1
MTEKITKAPLEIATINSIDSVYQRISLFLQTAQGKILQTINTEMVRVYWKIGREIVEQEQHGKERADYGKELLSTLYRLVYCCSKTENEEKKPTCRPCSPERLDHVPVLLLAAFLWQGPAFFCEEVFENLIVHGQIGIHFLQPCVLLFQGLHFLDVRDLKAPVLGLPVVKGGFGDTQFPANLTSGDTGFLFFKGRYNLRLRESGFFHDSLNLR